MCASSAHYDYDETAGTQTLARWFVDGPLYVDEHVMMHDATTGDDYFCPPQELYTVGGLFGELAEDTVRGGVMLLADLKTNDD